MGGVQGDSSGIADEHVFAQLYPGLRRFANVVRPAEVDADDLVQDALVRTLAATRLADLDDPGAYLRTAMVRVAANHRRSLGRRRSALARLRAKDAGAEDYPSDLADLMRLSAADRTLLYLVTVEGRSYADASIVLGCREATARARASRALRRLRIELDDEDQEIRDA